MRAVPKSFWKPLEGGSGPWQPASHLIQRQVCMVAGVEGTVTGCDLAWLHLPICQPGQTVGRGGSRRLAQHALSIATGACECGNLP